MTIRIIGKINHSENRRFDITFDNQGDYLILIWNGETWGINEYGNYLTSNNIKINVSEDPYHVYMFKRLNGVIFKFSDDRKINIYDNIVRVSKDSENPPNQDQLDYNQAINNYKKSNQEAIDARAESCGMFGCTFDAITSHPLIDNPYVNNVVAGGAIGVIRDVAGGNFNPISLGENYMKRNALGTFVTEVASGNLDPKSLATKTALAHPQIATLVQFMEQPDNNLENPYTGRKSLYQLTKEGQQRYLLKNKYIFNEKQETKTETMITNETSHDSLYMILWNNSLGYTFKQCASVIDVTTIVPRDFKYIPIFGYQVIKDMKISLIINNDTVNTTTNAKFNKIQNILSGYMLRKFTSINKLDAITKSVPNIVTECYNTINKKDGYFRQIKVNNGVNMNFLLRAPWSIASFVRLMPTTSTSKQYLLSGTDCNWEIGFNVYKDHADNIVYLRDIFINIKVKDRYLIEFKTNILKYPGWTERYNHIAVVYDSDNFIVELYINSKKHFLNYNYKDYIFKKSIQEGCVIHKAATKTKQKNKEIISEVEYLKKSIDERIENFKKIIYDWNTHVSKIPIAFKFEKVDGILVEYGDAGLDVDDGDPNDLDIDNFMDSYTLRNKLLSDHINDDTSLNLITSELEIYKKKINNEWKSIIFQLHQLGPVNRLEDDYRIQGNYNDEYHWQPIFGYIENYKPHPNLFTGGNIFSNDDERRKNLINLGQYSGTRFFNGDEEKGDINVIGEYDPNKLNVIPNFYWTVHEAEEFFEQYSFNQLFNFYPFPD